MQLPFAAETIVGLALYALPCRNRHQQTGKNSISRVIVSLVAYSVHIIVNKRWDHAEVNLIGPSMT